MRSFNHLILQLLLWNSYFIGQAASCGVPEELIRQRRRELEEQLPTLDELLAGNPQAGEDASSQTTTPSDAASSLTNAPSDAASSLTGTPSDAPPNQQILFDGILLNDLGEPMENAQIQFWHADSNGKYFHPGDDLDGFEYQTDTFSYFGTATADSNGEFYFRTYRPGIYLQRPITHIHFKVFFDGEELLTSQFYFGDEDVERFFDEMLILTFEDGVDDNGNPVRITQKEVVVNTGSGGTLRRTPSGVEGPYYPVVDFFDAGNDLTLGMNSDATESPEAPEASISTVAVFSSAGSFHRQLLLLTSSLSAFAFLLF